MNRLCGVANCANENARGAVSRRYTQMAVSIHVLFVGSLDRGSMIHDALLNGRNFHLTIATDYRNLWAMPIQESVHVAIVHNTLPAFETEATCRLIHRRWPHARIVVVHRGKGILDKSLYDDCVSPTAPFKALLAAIDRLTGMRNKRMFGNAEL